MVSNKIRSIMKDKNISNKQLAEYLGIQLQSLHNKFYRNTFTVSELIKILDFLNCNLVIESKPDTKIILTLDD